MSIADVDFELDLDALQLLDGAEAHLMIVHCTVSCSVSCSQSCQTTCGYTEVLP
jgi:hypothetical protein